MPESVIRHDWTLQEVQALFDLPFNDLLFRAQLVHRRLRVLLHFVRDCPPCDDPRGNGVHT